MLAEIEHAEDRAVLAERRGRPILPIEAVTRHLDGESLVTLWREERGLSQRDLADRAGISPTMLSETKRGKKSPSLSLGKGLATALGVGLDSLFD